jgi:ribosomal-protein-alanine N-acetyltransferase
MKSPILETERLILRPLKMSDVEAQYRYFNDYEIVRYLAAGLPWPYKKEDAEYFMRQIAMAPDNPSYFWAITKKDRQEFFDEMIGLIELRPHKEEGCRGFWLGHPFHGQGIMSEAATVTTDFWFDELKKPVINLHNGKTNEASRRIKEKVNARFITLIKGEYMDPKLTHTEVWEITADEWHKFRRKNVTQP